MCALRGRRRPDEITDSIGWDRLSQLLQSAEEKERYALHQTDPKATEEYSHSQDGEIFLTESNALPFYLTHIFQEMHELFDIVHTQLSDVELLLQALPPEGRLRARPGWEAEAFAPHASRTQEQSSSLHQIWTKLKQCDILILPSVLLFENKTRLAAFW